MSQKRDLVQRGIDHGSFVDLEKALKTMPEDMRAFSLCLRQLYVEKAMGTSKKAAEKFREIRDHTKDDALIYMENVLPLCTRLISSIDDFFDYFIELDAYSWRSSLSIIKEDISTCVVLCQTVKTLHLDIIETLRERENEMVCIKKDLDKLQSKLERKTNSYEERSERKHIKAIGFLFGENSQMAMNLFTSSEVDRAKAVAYGAQAETQKEAVSAVSKCLIPSLKSFIDSLGKVLRFFHFLSAIDIANFNMDKRKASEIKEYCRKFIRTLPAVKTDLKAIPSDGKDQNYIDRWLEKQTRAIKQSGSIPRYVQSLKAPLASGDNSNPKPVSDQAAESNEAMICSRETAL